MAPISFPDRFGYTFSCIVALSGISAWQASQTPAMDSAYHVGQVLCAVAFMAIGLLSVASGWALPKILRTLHYSGFGVLAVAITGLLAHRVAFDPLGTYFGLAMGGGAGAIAMMILDVHATRADATDADPHLR